MDDELIAAQARADSAYRTFGASAPRPLEGETVDAYRRRLANGLKQHSASWSKFDLAALKGPALEQAEAGIYADAMVASRVDPFCGKLEDGEERQITRVDPATGHRITTFHRRGHFVRDLMPPARMIKVLKGENR